MSGIEIFLAFGFVIGMVLLLSVFVYVLWPGKTKPPPIQSNFSDKILQERPPRKITPCQYCEEVKKRRERERIAEIEAKRQKEIDRQIEFNKRY